MSVSSTYQDLGRLWTEMTHQEQVGKSQSHCCWKCSWRRAFVFVLEADISSIWCKDDVTYYPFDDCWDNTCQSYLRLFNDSLILICKYCFDISIYHFKLPKVVLAHILDEVGTLYTVLLSVYARTCLPFFIGICLYLTDIEPNPLLQQVIIETRCICQHSKLSLLPITTSVSYQTGTMAEWQAQDAGHSSSIKPVLKHMNTALCDNHTYTETWEILLSWTANWRHSMCQLCAKINQVEWPPLKSSQRFLTWPCFIKIGSGFQLHDGSKSAISPYWLLWLIQLDRVARQAQDYCRR